MRFLCLIQKRKHLFMFMALAIPIAGLLELALQLIFAHRAPTETQWVEAQARVTALHKSGDLIAIAPEWEEPMARKAWGPELLPLRDIARPDETRYARAIEISALGAHLDSFHDWELVHEEQLGNSFRARILKNPHPEIPTMDFVDRVEAGQAEVAWAISREEHLCLFHTDEPVVASGLFGPPAMPSRRFVCGVEAWQSVGVTVQDDQQFHARRCIWSHPPADGDVIVRFRSVALGTKIRGHMGIHWILERERRGAPIDLNLYVNGNQIGSARHEDGQGWSLFDIALGDFSHRIAESVTFRFHTFDANERHLCWEADSR